ncbi:conserved Plasmodium protein, unknown function [Plasmodium knowlesi strain H]|uniref:HID1 domain-containing protein, putative n=3 Tax=Plasmodium knowlesi TaxID=5850 RepID=B3LBG3_PLAKH|nr:HID1 domain-containing protein, putative [Plasmodium knowlesi strain H]OTN66624.1 Uncharacterized protein PKNOH_S08489200 [Plasmodium knowlesi]CAA9986835.1 HID1 domain-containing protein, putative [Plasmodium knowlesi strain H]SBO23683.1 conserved Plasmodium protein, unknown function [Plasmodium knowlesi strain H]VVS76309.1 HID1 domain-containing protein, putative [Plasmodium knowlesi strain H]|eukprot:XP_002260681.1 hypothetical protein, conserved in Plasmodium species [Plasmodium knowlesi strain H]
MGQNNIKRIISLLEKANDEKWNDVDLYSELSSLGRSLHRQEDFSLSKRVLDDEKYVKMFFHFLMNTLEKLILKSSKGFIDDCKACVNICLLLLPVLQYNCHKKEVFDLLWRKNRVECPVQPNYACTSNVLILHLYNFFLLALFTEGLCIHGGGRDDTTPVIDQTKGERGADNSDDLEDSHQLEEKFHAINTVDVKKLWLHKFSIHQRVKYARSGQSELGNEKCEHDDKHVDGKEQGSSALVGSKEEGDSVSGFDDGSYAKLGPKCSDVNDSGNASTISPGEENTNYEISNGEICLKCQKADEMTTIHLKRNLRNVDVAPTHSNDINLELIKNRSAILKCLLILLSSYLYWDQSKYLKEKNFFLFLFTSGEIYYTANFFFSLLTVIYDNEFNYFSFYFYDNSYLEFYNLCIHIFNLLIDFSPFVLEDDKRVHYLSGAARYFYSVAEGGEAHIGEAHIGEAHIGEAHIGEAHIGEAHIGEAHIGEAHIGEVRIGEEGGGDASLQSSSTIQSMNQSGNEAIKWDDTLVTHGESEEEDKSDTDKSTKGEEHSLDKDEQRSNEKVENLHADLFILDDSSEGSWNSSSTCTDAEHNGYLNNSEKKKKKKKKKFPQLEHLMKKRNFYLNEINPKGKDTNEDYYYDYIKKQKEFKKLRSNNVYQEMLRKLDVNDISYIYKGALNILISYKLYYEHYEEQILFLHNYLCLLWHLMDNNRLFIRYMKNHNSSLFLFYILYILVCFNHHRKREMQALADLRKRDKAAGITVSTNVDTATDTTTNISNPSNTNNYDEQPRVYQNGNFNQSGKCDEFNVRKIDGLIYICLFIILKVSSNATICKNLNQKYDQKIKVKFPLRNVYQFDSYVDFLVYTLCMLINDNIFFLKFERIIDMSITILTNVSVYIKSMNTYSCESIINILKKVLKKEWLLSSQHHYYSLFLMLDFINNILSHNLNDNYNLIYMIIKNKDVFFSIHNLDQMLKDNCLSVSTHPTDHWVPTENWLINWKNKLPLQFIDSIIYDLANLIEEECDEKEILDYNDVVNLIKNHCSTIKNNKIPFIIRKYEKNILLSKWVTNYMYFLLFSHMYKENLFLNGGIKFIF